MSNGTETNCILCGHIIVQTGKGRTKDYCSDSCRDYSKFISAAETALLKIKSFKPDSIRGIKSQLWSMSNLTNGKKDTSTK